MTPLPFHLQDPAPLRSCVVFASPHSGRLYEPHFLRDSQLSLHHLRSSEDAFVDSLFADVGTFGAPLLGALCARSMVDLNRHPDDLDPAMIAGLSRFKPSAQARYGLGVIPRVVNDAQAIRSGKITLDQAQERIKRYHIPYHQKLLALLARAQQRFGTALLVDCHSMPQSATDHLADQPNGRPDMVIGTLFGTSCAPEISIAIKDAAQKTGFKVALDAPFAGAYSLQHYGLCGKGFQAIQLEINRSLYMDETRIEPNEAFGDVKTRLSALCAAICALNLSKAPIAAQ